MAPMSATRRSILQGWLATGVGMLAMKSSKSSAQTALLPVTPSCGPDDAPTLAGTEGPFFTPNTPVKRNFRPDAPGEALTLVGFVVGRDCQPVSNALVDLWHADAGGEYDNDGFQLRGHQFTDVQGRYVFETIIPAPYGRRTRHYHVKVQPPDGQILTTQLYFPNEAGNDSDFLFDPRLLMGIENVSDGKVGRFDFVLNIG